MKEVVLDIPHGGKTLPPEVAEYLNKNLTLLDLQNEADFYTKELYQEQGGIPDCNKNFFDYLRAIIDVNRKMDDFSRDGIIKTHTSKLKQLYLREEGIDRDIAIGLVEHYARPYLGRLKESVNKLETKLIVLGHSMDPICPPGGAKPGEKRPLINLANGGDHLGNPQKPYQASREIMEYISNEVALKLGFLNLENVIYNGQAVSFNSPFSGRKSIGRIGKTILAGKTALMIEINKSIITNSLENELIVDRPENISALRNLIHDLLEGVLGKITK